MRCQDQTTRSKPATCATESVDFLVHVGKWHQSATEILIRQILVWQSGTASERLRLSTTFAAYGLDPTRMSQEPATENTRQVARNRGTPEDMRTR